MRSYARCWKIQGLLCEHALVVLYAVVKPYARCCKVESLFCEQTMITLLLCVQVSDLTPGVAR